MKNRQQRAGKTEKFFQKLSGHALIIRNECFSLIYTYYYRDDT